MMGGAPAICRRYRHARRTHADVSGHGRIRGKRYISEATFKEFTRTQFPELNNRRALGFDKPNLVYTGRQQ